MFFLFRGNNKSLSRKCLNFYNVLLLSFIVSLCIAIPLISKSHIDSNHILEYMVNEDSNVELKSPEIPEIKIDEYTSIRKTKKTECWKNETNTYTPDYIIQTYFEITSDDDFIGFPGDGSIDDPYRIENYYFIGSIWSDAQIRISGTTKHFKIINCIFEILPIYGIYIENVMDGSANISYNKFLQHEKADIYLDGIQEVVIDNNMFLCQGIGDLEFSTIYITHSNYSNITRNYLSSPLNGIIVRDSDILVISGNYIENVLSNAIALSECNNPVIIGNYIKAEHTLYGSYFTLIGIMVDDCKGTIEISDNNITEVSSFYVKITNGHFLIINNNFSQIKKNNIYLKNTDGRIYNNFMESYFPILNPYNFFDYPNWIFDSRNIHMKNNSVENWTLFNNCTNSIVENNTKLRLLMYYCTNIGVINNNADQLRTAQSENIIIENNTLHDYQYNNIRIHTTTNAFVLNNSLLGTLNENPYDCLGIRYSVDSYFINNTIDNYCNGITIVGGENNEISRNTISNCLENGISIGVYSYDAPPFAFNFRICLNNISNNKEYGIKIGRGHHNLIFLNYFKDNNLEGIEHPSILLLRDFSQAYDDGEHSSIPFNSKNIWFDPASQQGNFWSNDLVGVPGYMITSRYNFMDPENLPVYYNNYYMEDKYPLSSIPHSSMECPSTSFRYIGNVWVLIVVLLVVTAFAQWGPTLYPINWRDSEGFAWFFRERNKDGFWGNKYSQLRNSTKIRFLPKRPVNLMIVSSILIIIPSIWVFFLPFLHPAVPILNYLLIGIGLLIAIFWNVQYIRFLRNYQNLS